MGEEGGGLPPRSATEGSVIKRRSAVQSWDKERVSEVWGVG